MKHTELTSKMLKSYGYADGVLEAQFHNGKIYSYPVSPELHKAFTEAESKGSFFAKNIRQLGGKLVEPPPAA